MNDAKLAECSNCPSHETVGHALGRVMGKGGLLDQARKAQAGGKLADFFQQLIATVGPLIGPILISLLSNLLHIPLPIPTK